MISEQYILALIGKNVKVFFDKKGQIEYLGVDKLAKDLTDTINKEAMKLAGNEIIKIANETEPK